MQTRNDYERGVFNGDIGFVVSVDVEIPRAVVDMEGIRASYERKNLCALQFAYAVSIHKIIRAKAVRFPRTSFLCCPSTM